MPKAIKAKFRPHCQFQVPSSPQVATYLGLPPHRDLPTLEGSGRRTALRSHYAIRLVERIFRRLSPWRGPARRASARSARGKCSGCSG